MGLPSPTSASTTAKALPIRAPMFEWKSYAEDGNRRFEWSEYEGCCRFVDSRMASRTSCSYRLPFTCAVRNSASLGIPPQPDQAAASAFAFCNNFLLNTQRKFSKWRHQVIHFISATSKYICWRPKTFQYMRLSREETFDKEGYETQRC